MSFPLTLALGLWLHARYRLAQERRPPPYRTPLGWRISNTQFCLLPAGSETSLQVIGDWRMDPDQLVADRDGNVRKKTVHRYSVGAEYFFGGAVPVRGGFELDDATKQNWWSAGAGYVTTKLALDVSLRQSTSHPSARTYGIALRIFVPNE